MTNPIMLFDVESLGLHGPGFAVGAVVFDLAAKEFTIIEELYSAAQPNLAEARAQDIDWLHQNVFPHLKYNRPTIPAVRDEFWSFWERWRSRGAILFADCAWPVEARFLIDCVQDDPDKRWWRGPYPLHDLASVHWMNGQKAELRRDRKPEETPEHHPLADARQSARLLWEGKRCSKP